MAHNKTKRSQQRSDSNSAPATLMLGAVFIFVLALVIGYFALREWSQRTWSSTPATVTHTEIQERDDPDFSLFISITWTINGETHSRDNVLYFEAEDPNLVGLARDRLLSQKTIPIYYPDTDPKQATIWASDNILLTGYSYSSALLFLGAGLFVYLAQRIQQTTEQHSIDQASDANTALSYYCWFALTPAGTAYFLSTMVYDGGLNGFSSTSSIMLIVVFAFGLLLHGYPILTYPNEVTSREFKFYEAPRLWQSEEFAVKNQ